LGFLGTSRFAAKTQGFGGCKSLDFLGFSRPDLDLSMGYTRFSAEDFSTALLSSRKRRGNGDPTIGHAERIDCSWDKLSLISDFLQDIAGSYSVGYGPSAGPGNSEIRETQRHGRACPGHPRSVSAICEPFQI
jgi:hypothetical protein